MHPEFVDSKLHYYNEATEEFTWLPSGPRGISPAQMIENPPIAEKKEEKR